MNKNLDETQFSDSSKEDETQLAKKNGGFSETVQIEKDNNPPVNPPPAQITNKFRPAIIALGAIFILIISVSFSGYFGFKQGSSHFNGDATEISKVALDQEYQRGVEDFEAGNYYIALQRFEFIYAQDP
ncbi:MAG: hypothetical protein HOF10_08430, partial [Chloroflexi bacterium]|nr:hypothetical protein [Chloroflexota bacterium]